MGVVTEHYIVGMSMSISTLGYICAKRISKTESFVHLLIESVCIPHFFVCSFILTYMQMEVCLSQISCLWDDIERVAWQ